MIPENICHEYSNWLFNFVCGKRYAKGVSYRKLLTFLHNTEFEWSIPKDSNRASDGISLRYRFAINNGYKEDSDLVLDCLSGPCSVLEMMVALAIRCEETIMDDPLLGDRTGQWFWGMIVNLGLGSMTDSKFNIRKAEEIIARFMDRAYEPDGHGGLFTVRHYDADLRDVEIWYQLCYYLDTIT